MKRNLMKLALTLALSTSLVTGASAIVSASYSALDKYGKVTDAWLNRGPTSIYTIDDINNMKDPRLVSAPTPIDLVNPFR